MATRADSNVEYLYSFSGLQHQDGVHQDGVHQGIAHEGTPVARQTDSALVPVADVAFGSLPFLAVERTRIAKA